MVIHDNYRGSRAPAGTTEVEAEPERQTKTWILATVAAICVFGLISWWLT